jgi:hypothetical protein
MKYIVKSASGKFLAQGRASAEYPDAIKYLAKSDAVAAARRWCAILDESVEVIAEYGFNGQRVVFKLPQDFLRREGV